MMIADIPAELAGTSLETALAQRESELQEVVRQAVRHRETTLAFQPIVHAARPDRVGFYEGLIRVLDPAGREIPARDFLPSIEATELGRQIDTQALEMGLATLAEQPDIFLSINMSARSIGYAPWMRALKDGLMKDRHIGERLILEITESSAMMVPELVTRFMNDLARHGISFALDDFGVGFTSFRYLRDFRFDIVKIDKLFSRGVAQDADNQVLAEALTKIAEQFDMMTVAEGVERAEDAAWLTNAGLDCLQGYYFASPTIHPAWAEDGEERTRRLA